jgi:hypothetical protein
MKVECIDAKDWQNWRTIVEGAVYTVKSEVTHKGERAYHLLEVDSVAGCPYFAFRFRPAVERKTDISALTALLKPSDEKILQHV